MGHLHRGHLESQICALRPPKNNTFSPVGMGLVFLDHLGGAGEGGGPPRLVARPRPDREAQRLGGQGPAVASEQILTNLANPMGEEQSVVEMPPHIHLLRLMPSGPCTFM